jgi:hypothetical protein
MMENTSRAPSFVLSAWGVESVQASAFTFKCSNRTRQELVSLGHGGRKPKKESSLNGSYKYLIAYRISKDE